MTARNYTALQTATTLSGSVTNSATSMTVVAFANLPAVPFTAVLEKGTANEEVVLVTAKTSGTLTVTRGYDGTTGVAHSNGASFEHCVSGIDYSEANTHVNATSNIHGVTHALADDTLVVHNTGNETVAGNKTLSGTTNATGDLQYGGVSIGRGYAGRFVVPSTDVNTTSSSWVSMWTPGTAQQVTLVDGRLYRFTLSLICNNGNASIIPNTSAVTAGSVVSGTRFCRISASTTNNQSWTSIATVACKSSGGDITPATYYLHIAGLGQGSTFAILGTGHGTDFALGALVEDIGAAP